MTLHVAAQEQALRINAIKFNIDKTSDMPLVDCVDTALKPSVT